MPNGTRCPVITQDRQCIMPVRANGLCVAHNARVARFGDVQAWRPVAHKLGWPDNLLLRLVRLPPTFMPIGCLFWDGPPDSKGYGRVTVDGKVERAHRAAYRYWVGPIPDGMVLDHECHNADPNCDLVSGCPHRRCVEPTHLAPKTQGANVTAGWAKRKADR